MNPAEEGWLARYTAVAVAIAVVRGSSRMTLRGFGFQVA